MYSKAPCQKPTFGTRVTVATVLILYNLCMIFGLMITWPILIAIAMSSEKRRKTFRQRLGGSGCPLVHFSGHCGKLSLPARRFPTIWIHALSVGEVTAVQPLVQRLSRLEAKSRIVLTTSTLNGFQNARRLFGQSRVVLAYFPYDLVWSVRSVIRKINPTQILLAETDLWPNFLMEAARRNVPVSIINLRFSPKSWKRLRQFKPLTSLAFGAVKHVCTQTRWDARRLRQLGVADHCISVTGNLKFDSPVPEIDRHDLARWRRLFFIDSRCRVVAAGSTHRGEELMVLKALEDQLKSMTKISTFLILAPRDPGRADQVMQLCIDKGFRCKLLSRLDADGGDEPFEVVVVDGIGHLKSLYNLADIAFVGGSLVPRGGHNPLEPVACGKPVIFGRHMEDFRQVAQLLLEGEGARQVNDTGGLADALTELLNDPDQCYLMGQRGLSVLRNNQGAVERTLEFLDLSEP